jgi:hypothetical protein|tara:strand:- start:260 stop:814 length:555 start_codon:yes stop_codon:yes gene_type:complete
MASIHPKIARILGFSEDQEPDADDIVGAITDLASENVAQMEGAADADESFSEREQSLLDRIEELENEHNETYFAAEVDKLTISGDPIELVNRLVTVHTADPEMAETLLDSFKAASEATTFATQAQTRVGSPRTQERKGSFEEAVKDYQTKNGSSYGEAYTHVAQAEPALFSEYSNTYDGNPISL